MSFEWIDMNYKIVNYSSENLGYLMYLKNVCVVKIDVKCIYLIVTVDLLLYNIRYEHI